MHKTSSSDSEFKPILKKRSDLDIDLEKLKNTREKISAKHFSRHDHADTERAAHSEAQPHSSSTFSSRTEEERIEEILMTQKNSNKLPIDNFVAGLHQIDNNDYAAEPVQVEKKEENMNDSFEEDEYVEEDEDDGDDEKDEEKGGYGSSSKNRRSSALHKNYYIRMQAPSNQRSDGNEDGNEKGLSSNVEKSFAFTLFTKYSGMSTCYVYGENGR